MLRALRARSPAPAASAIILNGNEILLVKRRYEPYRSYWSLPGGHIEPGESSLEAAIRETLEETGIEAEIRGIAGIAEVIGENKHYLIIVYWGVGNGDPQPGDDAEDARWVPRRELDALPLTPSTNHMLRVWRPSSYTHIVCRSGVCKTIINKHCDGEAVLARYG